MCNDNTIWKINQDYWTKKRGFAKCFLINAPTKVFFLLRLKPMLPLSTLICFVTHLCDVKFSFCNHYPRGKILPLLMALFLQMIFTAISILYLKTAIFQEIFLLTRLIFVRKLLLDLKVKSAYFTCWPDQTSTASHLWAANQCLPVNFLKALERHTEVTSRRLCQCQIYFFLLFCNWKR